MSDVKEQIKHDYLSGVSPKKLSEKYDTSLNTIKSWIKRYGWSKLKKERGAPSKVEGAPSVVPVKRKRGGQPGNKNATGPPGNKHAEKFGFFSKHLPEETLSIIREMPEDPLDVLWDQIQIAYAAIIRAQKIMYVRDQEDATTTKIADSSGNICSEKWEVQQAWDKQANFLSAQARAQKTLEGMINRYEDLLHKNWDLATDEQKARILQIKANTERMKSSGNDDGEDGVVIVNDAPTGEDIRHSDTEVPADIQQQESKHIILTSGRAGTKSSYAAIRTDYQVVSDPHGSAVVLRKHHNKLRKTVYKEMIRGINRLGISKKKFAITKSPMEITYKKYGTTIYFSGSDGIDDTKGIIDEDKPIKLVVLDELTEFFDDGEGEDELSNIEATFVRGNSSGFQMIYLYNPPKNPNAPINQWCKKMEKREDCIHIHTDYRDVPVSWLGQALVDSAEAMKRADEKMYRWVWLGQAVGVDELIYYMFGDRHRQKPDPNRRYDRIYIGGDYGQQNATTFEAFGLDTYRKKFPGLGEHYHSGRESGRQKSPSEYAQDLVEFMNELHEQYDNRVFYIFLDPVSYTHLTLPTIA